MSDFKIIFTKLFLFEGASINANVLLMCKLLIALLWYHGFYFKINDPFLPFIPCFDVFNQTGMKGVFEISLKAFFIIATLSLLFNFWVRTSSFILGSVVILVILSSKPVFSNHTLICGCALVLAGLTESKKFPRLIMIQLSIMYFGAFLNKVLDIDWWTGVYMHNWLLNVRHNFIYINISKFLPELLLAKILSLGAFSTELFIAITLLIKKFRVYALWTIVLFHLSIFTLTYLRFGHFLESILIITVALLDWPKDKIYVDILDNSFKKIVGFLDFDKKIVWRKIESNNNSTTRMEISGKCVFGNQAIKDIILYTPAFYILLFMVDVILSTVLYNHQKLLFILNLIFAWSMIAYFFQYQSLKEFYKKSFCNKTEA